MTHNVSILTPTFNRGIFLPLMIHNIMNQTYDKNLIEWVILDDGDKLLNKSPLFKKLEELISPVKLKYSISEKRMNIGDKRNELVNMSSNDICINMDDDDIYFDGYITHSVNQLLSNHKYTIVGCNDMLILHPYKKFELVAVTHNIAPTNIAEATVCFKRSHFNNAKFDSSSKNEGFGLWRVDDMESIGYTDIGSCMICVSHKRNTIDKSIVDYGIVITEDITCLLDSSCNHKYKLLSNILKIK